MPALRRPDNGGARSLLAPARAARALRGPTPPSSLTYQRWWHKPTSKAATHYLSLAPIHQVMRAPTIRVRDPGELDGEMLRRALAVIRGGAGLVDVRDLLWLREQLRRAQRPRRVRVYRCLDCGATFPAPKYIVVERRPPLDHAAKYRAERVRHLVPTCPRCGSRRIVACEELLWG